MLQREKFIYFQSQFVLSFVLLCSVLIVKKKMNLSFENMTRLISKVKGSIGGPPPGGRPSVGKGQK